MDRIDLHVEIPALPPEALSSKHTGECSDAIRARVVSARRRQIDRQGKANALLTPRELEALAMCDDDGIEMLTQASARLGLSARGYHRTLKVARTISDLAGCERIELEQMGEAIQYRRREAVTGYAKRV